MDRFRLWLLTLLLALSVIFIIRFSSTLEIFFFSIGLAYIFMPAVNGVERLFFNLRQKRKPGTVELSESRGIRGLAVLLVTLLALFLVTVLIGLIVPYLSKQIASLVADFPTIQAGLQRWMKILENQLTQMNLPVELTQPVNNFFDQLDRYLVDAALGLVTWLAQVSSGILNLVIVFILQIYFLMDGPRMIRLGRDYLLQNHLDRVAGFLRTSTKMVSRYLKTQVLISGCMATVAFIGLKIIGIRYAGLFAVMLFLFDFIPYIGSIAGTLIVIAFSLFAVSLKTAIVVGFFLLILQQLEGNVFAPKVQGKTVGVHAAVIMLSLLVCFELWGPIGMFFSVVIAGMVKILLEDVLEYLLHPEFTIRTFLSSGYDETFPETSEPEATEQTDSMKAKKGEES